MEHARTNSTCSFGNQSVIELPEVDEDIGHTLVHYLYTGTYQTLKMHNVSDEIERLTQYQRSVRLYYIARLHNLAGLQLLAQDHIESSRDGISIHDILRVAGEVYWKLPSDEDWFSIYLKKEMMVAFRADHALFMQEAFFNHIGSHKRFNRFLFKVMVIIYSDVISASAEHCGIPSKQGTTSIDEAVIVERWAPQELIAGSALVDEPVCAAESVCLEKPVFVEEAIYAEDVVFVENPVCVPKPTYDNEPPLLREALYEEEPVASNRSDTFTNIPVWSCPSPLQASDQDLLSDWAVRGSSRKSKKPKIKKGTKISRASPPPPPPPPPPLIDEDVCTLRVLHLIESDLWKTCAPCRESMRRKSREVD